MLYKNLLQKFNRYEKPFIDIFIIYPHFLKRLLSLGLILYCILTNVHVRVTKRRLGLDLCSVAIN